MPRESPRASTVLGFFFAQKQGQELVFYGRCITCFYRFRRYKGIQNVIQTGGLFLRHRCRHCSQFLPGDKPLRGLNSPACIGHHACVDDLLLDVRLGPIVGGFVVPLEEI